MFLLILLCILVTCIPIMIFMALLGWALMLAEVVIAIGLLIAAALVLPLLSQHLLQKTGRRMPVIPIALLILAAEVVLIWHGVTKPVDIGLPDRTEVASIHVQDIEYYDSAWERIARQLTLPEEDEVLLLDEIYTADFKRDFRIRWPWQESLKAEHVSIYKVELKNTDGEVLSTLHVYDDLTVRPLNKRGKEIKYRLPEEAPFDDHMIFGFFFAEETRQIGARWQGFIDALLGSLTYTDNPGELSFTFPETRPDGLCHLYLKAKGMVVYDPNGPYEPVELHAFSEEQEDQNWESGKIYTLSLNDSIFEYNYIRLMLEGREFTYDLLPYMHERYHKK